MKILFAVFLIVHGLIHLMGTAKAFGVAEIPQLTQQIVRPLGALWLLAAALSSWPRSSSSPGLNGGGWLRGEEALAWTQKQ